MLDAFLGSGALALEALSRGAERAVGFDSSPQALALARKNAASIGESARLTVRRADALKPPRADEAATLVFLDPPYGRDLIEDAVAALEAAGWVATGSIVVVETPVDEQVDLSNTHELLVEKTYGNSRVGFWRATA